MRTPSVSAFTMGRPSSVLPASSLDNATFGYLSDVFVLESHRGRGLATWFMEVVLAHPDLQGIRRWMLATADAHGLYRKVGFTPLSRPERIMEKLLPDPYGSSSD
jgi:GNAT superfamily N-acetyltransferase